MCECLHSLGPDLASTDYGLQELKLDVDNNRVLSKRLYTWKYAPAAERDLRFELAGDVLPSSWAVIRHSTRAGWDQGHQGFN